MRRSIVASMRTHKFLTEEGGTACQHSCQVAFSVITAGLGNMVSTRSKTAMCAAKPGTDEGRVAKRQRAAAPGSPATKITTEPSLTKEGALSSGVKKQESLLESVVKREQVPMSLTSKPKEDELFPVMKAAGSKKSVKPEARLNSPVPKKEEKKEDVNLPVAVDLKSQIKPESKAKDSSRRRRPRSESRNDEAWHPAAAPDIEDAGALAIRTRDVHERLLAAGVKGDSGSGPRRTVLEALISTILSQATTGVNQQRAFSSLVDRFGGDWARAREAGPGEIEEAIRCAGLANRKAPRIHAILELVHEEFGEYSLEHLRELDDKAAIAALTKYNGVGPKTASCVLMFNMNRPEMPVDTHVNRLSRRLGWTRPGSTPERTYDLLNGVVQPEIKYSLHVQLIKHGKRTCKSQRPQCDGCVLSSICPSAGTFSKRNESDPEQDSSD